MLQHGRLSAKQCIEIALSLTTALHHLHENGLVHRDVKPSNIIFVNGRAKLADIGLVSRADATMSVVGTEGFIPPEGRGSPQGDLYSLGKVLYEAATGMDRMEFPALPTNVQVIDERELFLELNAVVAKACRRDVKERYSSAQAMQADLILLQEGRSIRKSQRLEKQLDMLKRAAVILVALSVFGAGAWFYQAGQTKRMARLAKTNQTLAESNQKLADDKDELVREKQKQVLGFQVERGIELMDKKHYARSFLWLTKALKNVEPGTTAEEIHRIRLNQVLKRIPRLDQVLVGNGEMVLTGGISPDDRTVATAGFGGVIDFWDRETGERSRESIVDPDGLVRTLSFLKDGEQIITKNDHSMRIWDVEKGIPSIEIDRKKPFQIFDSVSPNGRYIVTKSRGNDIQLWNIENGEVVRDDTSFGACESHSWSSYRNDSTAVLIGLRGSAVRLISTKDGRDFLCQR